MADVAAVLDMWEEAQSLPPILRSERLLSLAGGELDSERIAGMTVGDVNIQLLEIRRQLFGRTLEVQANCSACGEIMEAALDLDDFAAPAAQSRGATLDTFLGGEKLTVRAPIMADLDPVAFSTEGQSVILQLLASCVQTEGGRPISPNSLDEAGIVHVAGVMAELDPLADITVAINCPHCGVTSEKSLDITSILQRDIGNWARRMLQDIHTIAAAYGWSERDILALTPSRRQAYLDMISS